MIFLEVDNVEQYWNELQNLGLHNKYKDVKLAPVRYEDWGKSAFYMTLPEYYGILENSTSKDHQWDVLKLPNV